MRNLAYLSWLLCMSCLFASKNTFSQIANADSSSQQNGFNNAVTLFQTSLGEQSPLYNGPEYYFYDPLIKGNAFFLDTKIFTPGVVFYDGSSYSDVPILYDLYSDKVAVLLYNHFTRYSLVKGRVKSFDYLGHHFKNISTDTISISINPGELKSGFYDELYSGKTEVLVKRSKSIQTDVNTNLNYFNPARDFYIRKNNSYSKITSQGTLLNLFKDKKKELDQYVKANQIKFRNDPEDAMVRVATYYDHLTN